MVNLKMLHATLLSLIITGIASVGAQNPTFHIVSDASSTRKCLTVKKSLAVEINDCVSSFAQRWEIKPGRTEVRLGVAGSTGYCLDAKTVNASSPVVISECNGKPWQQWIYTYTPDGGPLTLANNTNLCLDVPNSSNNNGVQVQTYACNGGKNQLWNVIPVIMY